jgi:MFS family permease
LTFLQVGDTILSLVNAALTLPFRALAHRNFRLYWFGHLISSTGTWTQFVALSWLVYRLTHSAVLLGAVGFSVQFPIFALAALGGVAADRFDRRKLILIAQIAAAAQSFLIAILALSGHIEIWHIFVLALGIGTATAFDIPARQSFIVETVERKDLMNAIALNSSAFQSARMVGPALAAFILAAGFEEGFCFLLNSFSYLVMILAVYAIRRRNEPRAHPTRDVFRELREGLRFVWTQRAVRYLIAYLSVASFWGASYVALMPIFAAEVLGSGSKGLGILMSGSGAGSIVGALFVATRATAKGPTRIRRFVGACGLGLGLVLVGFSQSTSLLLSAAFSAGAGALLLAMAATTNSCVQLMVPDEIRGRTMSIYAVMYVGALSLGTLFAGLVAGRIGAPWAVLFAGVMAIGTATVLARKLPTTEVVQAEISETRLLW